MDPGLAQLRLSAADARRVEFVRQCGLDTAQLEKYLSTCDQFGAHTDSNLCRDSAETLLKTAEIGLKQGIFNCRNPEDLDSVLSCLTAVFRQVPPEKWRVLEEPDKKSLLQSKESALMYLGQLQPKDQADPEITTLINKLKQLFTVNTLYEPEKKLTSEEVLDLFDRIEPKIVASVVRFLDFIDGKEVSELHPQDLQRAGVGLIARAFRRADPNREYGQISFGQGCQLVELAARAFELIGTRQQGNGSLDFGGEAERDSARCYIKHRLRQADVLFNEFAARAASTRDIREVSALRERLGKFHPDFLLQELVAAI